MMLALLQQAAAGGSKGTPIQESIGWVVFFLAAVGAFLFAFANFRRGRNEVGSEIELAVNRRPYLSDQELETNKLNRSGLMALLGLALIVLVVPLYGLRETGRQKNATHAMDERFIEEGKTLFSPAASGGLGCADCHGGMDAKGTRDYASYTVTDSAGRFVEQVKWQAPALDTVLLRYSRDEVRYILTYGRPFSPMPAWGAAGGGALTTQQIEVLINYLQSIQITPKQAQKEVADGLAKEKAAAAAAGHPYTSDGQALFNLGYYADVAGGAYSCGRCHTPKWSIGEKGTDGGGALGPNLTGGSTLTQFVGAVQGLAQQISFVCQGSDNGKQYGVHGQGTGKMPGFCQSPAYNPDTDDLATQPNIPKQDLGVAGSGMMTEAQVAAIVQYERGL
jgi:hypothetical protein